MNDFARQQTLGVLPENTSHRRRNALHGIKLSDVKQQAWARTKMATYAAMIEIMDDGIGRLIEVLKKNGQYDNTLILLLSDNGATCRRGKEERPTPCSAIHRIAAISPTPGKAEFRRRLSSVGQSKLSEHAGSVRHGMCHIIDILPTCLDAADVEFPASFRGSTPEVPNGASLMAAVKGADVLARPLFWEHQGSRAVYQDRWKLIADGKTAPWQLYNLVDDPAEQRELTKRFPERVDLLKGLWEDWAQENNVLPLQSGGAKERKERWGTEREGNAK